MQHGKDAPEMIEENTKFAQREQEEQILKFFKFDHLSDKLKDVSMPFHALAHGIVANIPRSAERTVALRKLLESKDAAVRAAL